MLSVVILGTGNVSTNLVHALLQCKGAHLAQWVGRNVAYLKKFDDRISISSDFKQLENADIYIIAVSDGAIAEIAEKLPHKPGIVVHTSGATPMSVIKSEQRGVFYPLQTFTRERILDISNVPICIEANDPHGLETLRKLANTLSEHVYDVDSEKRKKLHLAAVFANNFANHLFHISHTLCEKEHLPFELLKPLILETAKKLDMLTPSEAQTGPALRGDAKSMEKHLKLLSDTDHIQFYNLFSEAIAKTYEKKL